MGTYIILSGREAMQQNRHPGGRIAPAPLVVVVVVLLLLLVPARLPARAVNSYIYDGDDPFTMSSRTMTTFFFR